MPSVDLTAVTKPSTAPAPEPGRRSAEPDQEADFTDLMGDWMRKWAPASSGDTASIDAADQELPLADADPDNPEAVGVVAPMPIPVVPIASFPTPIPVQTGNQPLSVEVSAESTPAPNLPSELGSIAPRPQPGAVSPLPDAPGPLNSTATATALPTPAPDAAPPASFTGALRFLAADANVRDPNTSDADGPAKLRPGMNSTNHAHNPSELVSDSVEGSSPLKREEAPNQAPNTSLENALGFYERVDETLDVEQGTTSEAKSIAGRQTDQKVSIERSAEGEPHAETVADRVRNPESPIVASNPLTARVSPASIPHVILRLASDSEQKTQSVKLRLDPPRLGEVSVDLRMGENGLTLRIVSQTPEARDLLQQDLPRLQELLKASGLNLQLFSATCDLSGERSERQAPPSPERDRRSVSDSSLQAENPATILRRRTFDTSVSINAQA